MHFSIHHCSLQSLLRPPPLTTSKIYIFFCLANTLCRAIQLQTFFLPCELAAAIITAVHVSPSADVKKAMEELHNTLSHLQTLHPHAFYIT